MRLFVLFIFLFIPLSLFAKERNVIHFSGSIIALPVKALRRCIHDAAEHKRAQMCSGEAEQATSVKSAVQDFDSTTGTARREITITYQ